VAENSPPPLIAHFLATCPQVLTHALHDVKGHGSAVSMKGVAEIACGRRNRQAYLLSNLQTVTKQKCSTHTGLPPE
jgi:hypothetical protein